MRSEEEIRKRLDEARKEYSEYQETGGIAGEMYWEGVSKAFEWVLEEAEEDE